MLLYKIFSKYLFLSILIFGFFTVSASTTNGTADDTYYKALLCTNNTCTTYTLINFKTTKGNPLLITDTGITGNAWSESFGWINFNPTNGGVTNTPEGILGGYAWGENMGWINFKPTNGGVTINDSGELSGYAWVQNHGWLKFDCSLTGGCLKTDWRKESIRSVVSGGGGGGGGGGTIDPVIPPVTPVETPVVPPVVVTPVEPPVVPAIPPVEPIVPVVDPVVPPPVIPPVVPVVDPITPPVVTPPQNPIEDVVVPIYNNVVDSVSNFLNSIFVNDSPNSQLADKFNNLTTNSTKKIKEAALFIKDKRQEASGLVETPAGNITSKAITDIGVVSGAYIGTTALFVNPLSFADLLLIPIRLFGLLLVALGIKKKNLPWGTVYDSVTKQPLDPAYVTLNDLNGKEVATSITDLDGRYGFLVPAGKYLLSAGKTNYTFPSKKLSGKVEDELYKDLYFGEIIELKEDGVINKNIPMDPVKFDWNEFAKKDKNLMRFFSKRDIVISRITSVLFFIGFAGTVAITVLSPVTYNFVVLGIYLVMSILKYTILKPRPFGRIKFKDTDVPLSFAIVRVFSKQNNQEVIHKVADKTGKYFCLVPNDLYYAKIENKNMDESYTPVHTSETIEVKKGYINKKFDI